MFTTNSCLNDNDGYPMDNKVLELVTVKYIDEQSNVYSLLTDDNKKLWIAASDIPSYKPKNKRIVADYTILSDNLDGYDHYIKLNGLSEVLTKDIKLATTEELENMPNDPVKLYTLTASGGFVNLLFGYYYGGKQHEINMVKIKDFSTNGEAGKNTDNVIYLELRHNKNGDSESYEERTRACFDLTPYMTGQRGTLNLKIKVNEFATGIVEHSLEYKYELITAVSPRK